MQNIALWAALYAAAVAHVIRELINHYQVSSAFLAAAQFLNAVMDAMCGEAADPHPA